MKVGSEESEVFRRKAPSIIEIHEFEKLYKDAPQMWEYFLDPDKKRGPYPGASKLRHGKQPLLHQSLRRGLQLSSDRCNSDWQGFNSPVKHRLKQL